MRIQRAIIVGVSAIGLMKKRRNVLSKSNGFWQLKFMMKYSSKKRTDIRQSTEQLEWIGNICFCVYYAIMVVIKTFGYVSYETFFKIAFVIAVLFLGVKVLTTKYTMREFLILYFLLAISAICWLRVGEKNVLFITMTLWGMKHFKFHDLMKATVWIRIVGTALMILLALAEILDLQADTAISTGFLVHKVYGFGYIKANAAYYIIFVTIALFLYLQYDKLNIWHFLLSTLICFLAFQATFCRTGMIVFVLMWAMILFDKCMKNKKYYQLLSFTTAGVFAVSWIWMVIYQINNSFMFRINRMLNGRIEITNNYYRAYGTTLFPKTTNIFWDMNYTTIDNLYMYLFISCGAVFTVLFIYWATKSQYRLYKFGYYREILFFTLFVIYAVLEQSPMNPILNPFILLTANLIYKDYKVR